MWQRRSVPSGCDYELWSLKAVMVDALSVPVLQNSCILQVAHHTRGLIGSLYLSLKPKSKTLV